MIASSWLPEVGFFASSRSCDAVLANGFGLRELFSGKLRNAQVAEEPSFANGFGLEYCLSAGAAKACPSNFGESRISCALMVRSPKLCPKPREGIGGGGGDLCKCKGLGGGVGGSGDAGENWGEMSCGEEWARITDTGTGSCTGTGETVKNVSVSAFFPASVPVTVVIARLVLGSLETGKRLGDATGVEWLSGLEFWRGTPMTVLRSASSATTKQSSEVHCSKACAEPAQRVQETPELERTTKANASLEATALSLADDVTALPIRAPRRSSVSRTSPLSRA
mmetsp:Transcript_9574/g.17659  ORF Transcript_9574/g.17659 Transcript_9574/m.17659 type:complete len:281 (-) Transcript_9574:1248-2090(-)